MAASMARRCAPARRITLRDLDHLRLPGVSPAENPARLPLDTAPASARRPSGSGRVRRGRAPCPHGRPLIRLPHPPDRGRALRERHRHAAGQDPHGGGHEPVDHPGDVRDLFDVLPPGSLDKVFLNYPDPWPKARHHRRRFVTPGYLGLLTGFSAPAPNSAWQPTSRLRPTDAGRGPAGGLHAAGRGRCRRRVGRLALHPLREEGPARRPLPALPDVPPGLTARLRMSQASPGDRGRNRSGATPWRAQAAASAASGASRASSVNWNVPQCARRHGPRPQRRNPSTASSGLWCCPFMNHRGS